MKTWCANTRGLDGTPLSYIIRKNEEPMDYVEGVEWTIDEELINRHSLYGKYYSNDNTKVWTMITSVFLNTNGWNWISDLHPTQDGRKALLALERHYLDDSTQSVLFSAATQIMSTLQYKGEHKNFTFEDYKSTVTL